MQLLREAVRGAAPVYLVDVEYAGRVARFGSRAVEVQTDAGELLRYDGQLGDLDWADTIGASPSVEVAVRWPWPVARSVQRGIPLTTGRASVALWLPGTTYEARIRIVEGPLLEPQYGGPEEPVVFTVEDAEEADRGAWPPLDAVITLDTWPDADPAALGRTYPWPFGEPGVYTEADGAVGLTSGSVAYLVDSTAAALLLVALGRTRASSLTVIDATNDLSEVFPLVQTRDYAGRTVTVADMSGAMVLTPAVGVEYLVRWDQGGGGAVGPDGDDLGLAGNLLAFLLRQVRGLPVDWGRVDVARAELNRIAVGGCLAEPVVPWDWLASNLGRVLPYRMHRGPRGRYPLTWRLNARPAAARAHLVVGSNCARGGRPVQYDRRDVANEITIRFAARARQATDLRRSRTISGQASVPEVGTTVVRRDTWRSWYSTQSVLSLQRPGDAGLGYDDGVRAKLLQAPWLWQTEAADQVLVAHAQRYAFPDRLLDLDAPFALAWLSAGDQVLVTDADLELASQVCEVVSVTPQAGSLLFSLRLLDDPIRDTIPAP